LRTKDTREKLLHSAINLFYQKGYSNTSVREIGVKAGISNSLLYHYFKNKEEILFEIIKTASQDLIEALRGIEETVTDPVECLREMLVAHTVIFGIKRKKEAKMLAVDLYLLRGKNREIIWNAQRVVYDIYMKKLKEIKKKGRLKNIDLTVLNFSIFGVIGGFYRWYKEGGRLSREQVAQNIEKFVFHGILEPESSGD
jgi:AcrR family transcriptional regulator